MTLEEMRAVAAKVATADRGTAKALAWPVWAALALQYPTDESMREDGLTLWQIVSVLVRAGAHVRGERHTKTAMFVLARINPICREVREYLDRAYMGLYRRFR